jgi:hypothetical protein
MSEPLKILNPVEDPNNPPTKTDARCANKKNQRYLQPGSCMYEICPLTDEQLLNNMLGGCSYERKPYKKKSSEM